MMKSHTAESFLSMQDFDRVIKAVKYLSMSDAEMRKLVGVLQDLHARSQAEGREDCVMRLSIGNLVGKGDDNGSCE